MPPHTRRQPPPVPRGYTYFEEKEPKNWQYGGFKRQFKSKETPEEISNLFAICLDYAIRYGSQQQQRHATQLIAKKSSAKTITKINYNVIHGNSNAIVNGDVNQGAVSDTRNKIFSTASPPPQPASPSTSSKVFETAPNSPATECDDPPSLTEVLEATLKFVIARQADIDKQIQKLFREQRENLSLIKSIEEDFKSMKST